MALSDGALGHRPIVKRSKDLVVGKRGFRRILAAVAFMLFAGCAGGGGSDHHPPDRIVAGEPTALTATFSVWGSESRELPRRYSQILCHYRHAGEQHFQSIPATIVSYDNKHMLVEFVIPPQQSTSETDSLEYYFDFLFDGYYGKRPIEHVRITAKS